MGPTLANPTSEKTVEPHNCTNCPVRARHFEGPENASSWVTVSAAMTRRTYRAGQTLCVQGNGAERVFFVRSGSVRLTRVLADGSEILLDFLGSGGVIGANALFGGDHATTATACGTVQCCTATATSLRLLLPEQPGLALALLRLLGEDADRLRGQVAEFASRRAEERVARFMVQTLPQWLASAHGFTQGDVARSLALTPETLCRVLADFRKKMWISGQGRRLQVLQAQPLLKLAAISAS